MNFPAQVKEKLDLFSATILKWNQAYSIIAHKEAEDIWNRHILDSTQIFELLTGEEKVVADFGSGGGFPSIPLAIMAEEKNLLTEFIMFESVTKKTTFLEEAIRVLKLRNISVRNERIEKVKDVKADLVTARAFAKVIEIFKMAKNFRNEDTKFILHKGRNIEAEINEALQEFTFEHQLVKSITGDGFIFLAKNLKEK